MMIDFSSVQQHLNKLDLSESGIEQKITNFFSCDTNSQGIKLNAEWACCLHVTNKNKNKNIFCKIRNISGTLTATEVSDFTSFYEKAKNHLVVYLCCGVLKEQMPNLSNDLNTLEKDINKLFKQKDIVVEWNGVGYFLNVQTQNYTYQLIHDAINYQDNLVIAEVINAQQSKNGVIQYLRNKL